MATCHPARVAQRAGVTPPVAREGLDRLSAGFLRPAPGVTFQRLGWFLRSRPLMNGGGGRSAGRIRLNGLWLRAYDRFASDWQRVRPIRPVRAALAMFLIGRDCALAPVAPRPRPETWPLASPAVESGTPPGHDKEPSRASERAARPLRTGLVRR